MKRNERKFIGWVGSDSICAGATADGVLSTVLGYVLAPKYLDFGPLPVLVRVTTYGAQRHVSQIYVGSPAPVRLHDPDYPLECGEFVFGGRVYREFVPSLALLALAAQASR